MSQAMSLMGGRADWVLLLRFVGTVSVGLAVAFMDSVLRQGRGRCA